MKKNCSLEEKLAAIRLVEQGQSARSVSDKLHLGHHILYEWIESYKLRGIEGLKPKGKRSRRLSYEEKCKIIREYQESELTLCQLSAKYDIASSLPVLGRPSFRGARASNPSLSTNRTQLPNTELATSYLAESWYKVNSLS